MRTSSDGQVSAVREEAVRVCGCSPAGTAKGRGTESELSSGMEELAEVDAEVHQMPTARDAGDATSKSRDEEDVEDDDDEGRELVCATRARTLSQLTRVDVEGRAKVHLLVTSVVEARCECECTCAFLRAMGHFSRGYNTRSSRLLLRPSRVLVCNRIGSSRRCLKGGRVGLRQRIYRARPMACARAFHQEAARFRTRQVVPVRICNLSKTYSLCPVPVASFVAYSSSGRRTGIST